MRPVALLLAIAVLSAFPGHALAEPRPGPRAAPATYCLTHPSADDGPSFHNPQCMGGVAVAVAWGGMKVRPVHGKQLSVRFTDETEFATDSGEGALDGLTPGDHVCVTYSQRKKTVTALVVVFDLKPVPCRWSGSRRSS